MAAGKTGALVSCSAAVGAVLAGAPADTVAALEAYGERVGLAFQLEDDLLGIWGDPAVTGKPALADLRARKKSLPVAAALATGGPAAGRLRRLAGHAGAAARPHRGRPGRAARRSPTWSRRPAGGRGPRPRPRRQVALAEQALADAPVDPGAAAELVALARSLLGRSA